jgi:hypothetical protein
MQPHVQRTVRRTGILPIVMEGYKLLGGLDRHEEARLPGPLEDGTCEDLPSFLSQHSMAG